MLQATLVVQQRVQGSVHPQTILTAKNLELVRSKVRGKRQTVAPPSPTALAEAEARARAAEAELLAMLELEDPEPAGKTKGKARRR